MPRKSIVELEVQATSDFPDNAAQLITPAKLRGFVLDFLKTMSPFYGLLKNGATLKSVAITPTPNAIQNWDAFNISDLSMMTINTVAGTITRTERGVCRVTIQATCIAANNSIVTFSIYQNGLATGYQVTIVGVPGTDPQSVNMVAILDAPAPLSIYTLRISATTNQTVQINNCGFIVENIPNRTFE